jgi:hypothetical protein
MAMSLNLNSEERRMQRDIDALMEQVRELKENTQITTQSLADQFKELNAFVFQNVPPIVNYIDNGDFVFEQEDYVAGTNYTDDHLDCATWYQRLNSSTGQVTEHTTTVRSNDHISTNTGLQAYWVKANGEISFGTAAAILSPLPKNLAFPASTIFCRMQVKKTNSGIVIPDNYRLRASIWDNTSGQQKVVEGAVFDISATPAVGAPGSFTRQYILRVDSSMDFFYSDVLTPVSVANQVSVSATDNVNFVTVSWQVFPEAVRYRLYRHDSEFNEWRLIADIFNGANSFRDVGGRTGELLNLPGANILPRAHALFVNFGEFVTDQYKDVIFNIFVPSNYNYALTTNKQWIRLDMVDENLSFVTIPDEALLIDKFAVGYNNGRFTYSSRDLAAVASVVATTPPPVPVPGGDDGDGGGSVPLPGGGEGQGRCVTPDTLIAVVENNLQSYKQAKDVKVGDCLLNLEGLLSRVESVIKGYTSRLYIITTDKGKRIKCSPSHRLMSCLHGDEGREAHELKVGDWLWVKQRGAEEIVAIEVLDLGEMVDVLTFKLEGHRTYLSNDIFSHNLKPILL